MVGDCSYKLQYKARCWPEWDECGDRVKTCFPGPLNLIQDRVDGRPWYMWFLRLQQRQAIIAETAESDIGSPAMDR